MNEPSLTVRASSWARLFDCAHAFEGEHILGYRKHSGLRAHLGTSIHASTAAYDKGRLPGAEPVSIDEAAGVFIDTLAKPDREVDPSVDDLTLKDAQRIGLQLHVMYCEQLSPRFQFASVEQTLAPLDIDCGGGTLVRLTGTMDRARVALTDAGPVIPDIKTGSRVIVDGEAVIKGRSAQIGTYQILYERTEGIETSGGQVLALSTTKNPRVAASKVWDAKRVMLGTEDNPGLLEYAAAMFRSGLFPPNPASQLCSKRYCARWDACRHHED